MENKELIAEALKFRAVKLWEVLDDSMIFAVRLPDGEIGYCCVMGNAGDHYALAVYKGNIGFSTYLNSIDSLSSHNPFEIFLTFECINCDFENGSDSRLNTKQKALIKEVAKENGLKICRPKGYPDIIKYNRGVSITELDVADVEVITTALKAGLEVASKVKNVPVSQLIDLGFDATFSYPPVSGGKQIPMLIPENDGSFRWTLTKTPAKLKDVYPKPVYDNVMTIGRLKSLPHSGVFECKVFHMPATVKYKGGVYYPLMMMLLHKESGMLMPVMNKSEEPLDYGDFLNQFAFMLLNSEKCPVALEVSDGFTHSFLTDFCSKTGINLKKVKQIHELDNAIAIVTSQMSLY